MMEAEGVARPLPLTASLGSVAWIVRWWAIGRGLVIVGALAIQALGPAGYLRASERTQPFAVLDSWDARWYRIVASHGYLLVPGRQSDPAFFPLFPLLLRAAHAVGIGYGAAGILIANGAFLLALVAFHALTRELLGAPLAERATVYLAIFPFGYVFSMAYPESVVLAAIALAGVAALRDRWGLAAVCAAAAALARPEGAFVALPLLAIAWRRRRRLSVAGRGLAFGAVIAPAGALASFSLYLGRITHDPFAWSRAERAWGRHFSPLGVVHSVTDLGTAVAGNAWVIRDVVAVCVYLVLLVLGARAGAPRAWLASGAAILMLPLFSGSFTSLSRFGLLALPVFWGLAALGARPRADRAIRALSLVLLAAGIATVPLVFP